MRLNCDWHNEEDYAYTKDHSDKLWAWEFLRRNPEYQEDWNRSLKEHIEFCKEYKDVLSSLGAEDQAPENPDFSIPTTIPETWGLEALVNPEQPKPNKLRFVNDIGIILGKGTEIPLEDEAIREVIIPQGKAFISIDLTKPIKPQLTHYQEVLLYLQERQKEKGLLTVENKRLHRDNWLIYLRVWDAMNDPSNPKDHEIAEMIFPFIPNEYPNYNGNKRVTDSCKSAERLIYGGYRQIISYP